MTPSVTGGNGMIEQLVLFGVIFVAMYFFMIKPQNKKAQEQKRLLDQLSVGEEVVLASGIMGKVSKIVDEFIALEVADGIEIKAQKQAIATVLPKGTLKKIC
ncbi:MAG: preprotein translocase subunit YajC [Gammaproteobacteria bacterium]